MNRQTKCCQTNGQIKDFREFTRELLTLANESSQAFLTDSMSLMRRAPAMPSLNQHKTCNCGCECEENSETECCEVQCHAHRGERVLVPIRFTNRTDRAAHFKVSASPWQNADGGTPGGSVEVQPESFALKPSESVMVRAFVDVNREFLAGSSYRTDIVFAADNRQESVCLVVAVCSDEDTACAIDYGPFKKSTQCHHHWCDHFYCDRPEWVRERNV